MALLAINTTTMGIVLTKIRDLVDSRGHSEAFKKTRQQMLLSVKEQIVLIILAIVLLTISESSYFLSVPNFDLLINALISGIFVYSMMVLYDTAISVLIIIDFDAEKDE